MSINIMCISRNEYINTYSLSTFDLIGTMDGYSVSLPGPNPKISDRRLQVDYGVLIKYVLEMSNKYVQVRVKTIPSLT